MSTAGAEFALMTTLMASYQRNIRPVLSNKPVPVTFDIALNQVLDLVRSLIFAKLSGPSRTAFQSYFIAFVLLLAS